MGLDKPKAKVLVFYLRNLGPPYFYSIPFLDVRENRRSGFGFNFGS